MRKAEGIEWNWLPKRSQVLQMEVLQGQNYPRLLPPRTLDSGLGAVGFGASLSLGLLWSELPLSSFLFEVEIFILYH